MLSVLVPIYNYNAYSLVLELHKQCLECEIEFEILCQDDASQSSLNTFNENINALSNCSFSSNTSNLGRGKNINFLAEKAKFEWLLIMDCDTFPKHHHFIRQYVSQIHNKEKIVFGGIEYQKEKPNDNQLLRWVYGSARETIPVIKRNSNPNGTALTSNLLIAKKVFISNPFDDSIIQYGYEDLVFLSDLKKKGIVVKHIDNPTFHLGLESSRQFLDKTKMAMENLKLITEKTSLDSSESKLLMVSVLIRKLYLDSIISFVFKKTKRKLERNLLSQKPSLLLFDFYKLGYYCTIKK